MERRAAGGFVCIEEVEMEVGLKLLVSVPPTTYFFLFPSHCIYFYFIF